MTKFKNLIGGGKTFVKSNIYAKLLVGVFTLMLFAISSIYNPTYSKPRYLKREFKSLRERMKYDKKTNTKSSTQYGGGCSIKTNTKSSTQYGGGCSF